MGIVIRTPPAHTRRRRTLSAVRARRVTRTLEPHRMLCANVRISICIRRVLPVTDDFSFSVRCEVNNGGCHEDALCTHDKQTNAAKCTCKTGFTDTGSGSNVICTGRPSPLESRFLVELSRFQIAARSIKVDVIQMPSAHTIERPMLSSALARLVSPTQAHRATLPAKV